MPKENIINCPACGFSIRAGSKSCDFCGYEFESDELPSAKATVASAKETVSAQSQRPPASRNGSRKQTSGSKKGSKSNGKSNGNGKNGNGRKSRSQASSAQAEAVVEVIQEPEEVEQSVDPASDPQRRIKELEKQLSDAEKELDVISKLLGDGRGKEKEEAAAQSMEVVAPRKEAPPVEVVSRNLSSSASRGSVTVSGASTATSMSSGTGRLFFHFRGISVGAIVVGLIVYALSFVLMSNIGMLELYLLILPASVLVALGIYASVEGSPISQRL